MRMGYAGAPMTPWGSPGADAALEQGRRCWLPESAADGAALLMAYVSAGGIRVVAPKGQPETMLRRPAESVATLARGPGLPRPSPIEAGGSNFR